MFKALFRSSTTIPALRLSGIIGQSGSFKSGLSIAGLDVLWQRFALGCLIIIAVGIDQWIRKVSN